MHRQIRNVNIEDLDALAKMYMSAYACEPWCEMWKYDQAYERVTEVVFSQKSLCFVYEEDKLIKGCVLCMLMSWHTGKQLEIKELFVDSLYHNQGIGKRLVHHIESLVFEYDISEIFLWAMKTRENHKLVALYKRLGYKTDVKMVAMVKMLGDYL